MEDQMSGHAIHLFFSALLTLWALKKPNPANLFGKMG
jgi:hypothetical protein